MKARKITTEIIAGLFIILWVYAGLNKMMDAEFSTQLHRSPYLDRVADLVQYTLPIGEIIIAFLLVFPRTKLLGLYLSFFTMFLFTGYIYAMLNFSHYTPCSCGGILSKLDWNSHLIFNIIFTLLAILAIMTWEKGSPSHIHTETTEPGSLSENLKIYH